MRDYINKNYTGLLTNAATNCNGLSIAQNNYDVNISIYPNPASRTFNLNNLSKESNISIYNEIGILVLTQSKVTEMDDISIEALQNGLYYVIVQSDSDTKSLKLQISK